MKILTKILNFLSHSHISKYPLFYSYKPNFHKIKGYMMREILDVLEPGDIILRAYDGYLNTILTPGYWGHACIYIGDDTIIHAVGVGVIEEDILDYLRTDHICVMRLKKLAIHNTSMVVDAVEKAKKMAKLGIKYDYEFESDDDQLYCTELINDCYNDIFRNEFENVYGKVVITPEGIYNSVKLDTILEYK